MSEGSQPIEESTFGEDSQTEIPPKIVYISEAGNNVAYSGQQYIVQKSQITAVIGWFVVIWGFFVILSSPLNLLDTTDFDGNTLVVPLSVKVSSIFFAFVTGSMCIYGGYKITRYQKIGVWVVFASLIIDFFSFVIYLALFPEYLDSGLGPTEEAIGMMAGTACYSICTLSCAGIVGLPMLLSNGGLE